MICQDDFENPHNVHVLIALARSKNNPGLTANSQVMLRKICRNMNDYITKLEELKLQCENRDLNFYLYVSVNPRDVTKAYKHFKKEMIGRENAALFNDNDEFYHYAKRIDQKWYTSLMKPQSKGTKRFLIDIDEVNEYVVDFVRDQLKYMRHPNGYVPKIHYVKTTRNGYHMVTDPFNPQLLNVQKFDISIKKDGLLQIGTVGFDDS